MNILGISGSPRADGNTAFAVKHALSVLAEQGAVTRYLSVANKTIEPCLACITCRREGVCVHDDDMLEFLEAWRWCDGVIIGSPVYFGSVTGSLKNMLDRTFLLRNEFELAGKIGGAIACGGIRSGGVELTLQSIHAFMLIHDMLVIGDGQPYVHLGATVIGEAGDDVFGIETVGNLARNLWRKLIEAREQVR